MDGERTIPMQKAIGILWPSFLVAAIAEMMFFALFDPVEMHFLGADAELSRMTVYAIGFIFFWGIGVCASVLSIWLSRPPVGPGGA